MPPTPEPAPANKWVRDVMVALREQPNVESLVWARLCGEFTSLPRLGRGERPGEVLDDFIEEPINAEAYEIQKDRLREAYVVLLEQHVSELDAMRQPGALGELLWLAARSEARGAAIPISRLILDRRSGEIELETNETLRNRAARSLVGLLAAAKRAPEPERPLLVQETLARSALNTCLREPGSEIHGLVGLRGYWPDEEPALPAGYELDADMVKRNLRIAGFEA